MTHAAPLANPLASYRNHLPQLHGQPLLTDGGLETALIFHHGIDVPHFAAFDLLKEPAKRETIRAWYAQHVEIARRHDIGFILDAPTWRAHQDWGERLGYSAERLAAANRDAVSLMFALREQFQTQHSPMVVSGNIGPRGDGYRAESMMSAHEAQRYHTAQIATLADAGVDMITVMTMTYADEATGLARAAKRAGVPLALSFTVETDGRLPSGQPLGEAIRQVDRDSAGSPAYYMVNCAHPDHFKAQLAAGAGWSGRIGGIRANASRLSHAELDACQSLDEGDPQELGRDYAQLKALLPGLRVFGGCCGTDHRHVSAIADACCG